MLSFQERKALRLQAKADYLQAQAERMKAEHEKFERWMEWASVKTLCDWCNTEKPRHDFLHLERDEAGLEPNNDEGETNCCADCADDYLDMKEDCLPDPD